MIESFIAPLLMAVEILAVDFVFGALLTRRNPFLFRAIASVIVCLEIVILIEIAYFPITGNRFSYNSVESYVDSVYKFIYYVIIFGLTIGCMRFSYNNSIWIILFYCSGGYAAQHIAKNIASFAGLIPGFSDLPWLTYIIEPIVCFAVCVLVYFLFVRGKSLSENTKGIRKKVLMSLFVIFVCIGLSRISTDDGTRGTMAFVSETLYAVVSCSLILFNLFNLSENDEMQNEVNTMTELLHREKEQYKLAKENIDLINIKCHDLKHQIKALRQDASESHIRKIEEAVMIYDSVMKTGNDVLDVILTEKSLYCEKHHIRLTCVVHGEALSFMDNMDIYSLFGNALSNAIEEVSKIEREEKRFISMNVQSAGKFLSIHIENFYEGEIKFENDFPVTSKDKDYHGFGMKSMRYIAKQYGGYMSVSAAEGKFRLDFIFPLPEEKAEKDK